MIEMTNIISKCSSLENYRSLFKGTSEELSSSPDEHLKCFLKAWRNDQCLSSQRSRDRCPSMQIQ